MTITYKAVRRDGVGVSGKHDEMFDVSAFVASRFKAGYQSLQIFEDGRIVGEITQNVDGNRTWWSE